MEGDRVIILVEDRNDNTAVMIAADAEDTPIDGRCYPTRACRSVVGNQPYNTYTPCITFLQLGTVQAHRSVLQTNRLARMTKEEQLLATTTMTSEPFVDDMAHRMDQTMCTTLEEELGVMVYILTQYNLKPGLRKFGT